MTPPRYAESRVVEDYAVGVLDRCDECGRLTACRAVMDPDDPLGWVIEGWICHPCHAGEWADDDE
jgi:hypothetical protein